MWSSSQPIHMVAWPGLERNSTVCPWETKTHQQDPKIMSFVKEWMQRDSSHTTEERCYFDNAADWRLLANFDSWLKVPWETAETFLRPTCFWSRTPWIIRHRAGERTWSKELDVYKWQKTRWLGQHHRLGFLYSLKRARGTDRMPSCIAQIRHRNNIIS